MGSQDRGFSQFLQSAASFMPESNSSSSTSHSPHAGSAASEGHGKKTPSPGDVLSNAKIVFEAALSKLHKAESESGGANTFDKAKVGAAAAALLAAAKHYGKMEDKSYGKYIQQAEDYLNKYGHNPEATAGNSHVNHSTHPTTHPTASHSTSAQEEEEEGNKYSKYLHTAQGLFNKF